MHKPLHEDVSADRAWVVGRRIYVRCPKNSQLDKELIELGAKWDWGVRARWVGTGKRERVLPLVLADEQRARAEQEAARQVLAAGRWVTVPRGVVALHGRAGELGAVWDSASHRYAMPSEDSRAELQRVVDAWVAEQKAAQQRRATDNAEARATQEAEAKAAAVEEAERRRAQIVADSGRASTGDTETLHTISTRRMNRATAESTAWPVGTVHPLRGGRRGLVVARKVWFTNDDDATDIDWHPDAPDEAHWNFQYTLAIVEPTDAELRADAEAAELRADAAQLHALFRELGRAGRVVDAFTAVPDSARVGTIRGRAGTPGTSSFDTGTVILTDDRVVWQHPGHHDDWIRTEAVVTGSDQLDRVRALLAAGARTRHHVDQLTYTYEITTTATP
ncbi:hypothetical protein GCM10027258_79430 [Amycolatopsis stemonae]